MAASSRYDWSRPTYPTDTAQDAFDTIKQNFIMLRNQIILGQAPALNGTTLTYTYSTISMASTEQYLTAISISGGTAGATFSGAATYVYATATGNISREDWTIMGFTYSASYIYSGDNLATVVITVSS